MAEPQYVVRAVKFHCVDESGVDWLGSDEPLWIFTANDEPTPGVTTKRSEVFSNVDSGDTEKFDATNDKNVIWPQSGGTAGAPGPIGLSIQLWEIDQGSADEIASTTQAIFEGASYVPVVGEWVAKLQGIIPDLIGSLAGDDLMGSTSISYRTAGLAKRHPNVGDKFTEKFHLGSGSGDIPFGLAGEPDYDLYLEFTRVS